MSQPRQVPTYPSSPSKSSLRRTSGPLNPSSASSARALLPSPHFEDDPIAASQQSPHQAIDYSGHEHDNEHEHAVFEGGESEQYGQPDTIPSFQPFFTLIEDSVTNEHHHPTVHYIFADDDPELIADAACRSLETLDPSQQARSHARSRSRADDAQEGHDGGGGPRLPTPIAGVREHYLVLDVQPRLRPHPQDSVPAAPMYEVTSAQSFSAEWQVLRSTITTAPTIGDGGPGEDDTLMLRIEGRGNTPGDGPAPGPEKESMEEMIDRFQRRLEDIRQVMEVTSVNVGGTGEE